MKQQKEQCQRSQIKDWRVYEGYVDDVLGV